MHWNSAFLGMRHIPPDLSEFEIQAFFTFTPAELQLIEDRRRGPTLRLGLALQIGFLRMSGRVLDAVRVVPPTLWRHLGEQLAVRAPDLASLRAMYRRRRTLFEHQEFACGVLGFKPVSKQQHRLLVSALRQELGHTGDRSRLLTFARSWLYERKLVAVRDRDLRSVILSATRQYEAAIAKYIHATIDAQMLARWSESLVTPQENGGTLQAWLWSAPAKHSTRQIEEMVQRIEKLYELGVHQQLSEVPNDLLESGHRI